jgi:small subunit ribosomal protein S20
MPQSRSAKKDVRQIEKRRLRNKARSSSMKTAIRKLDVAVADGDAPAVKAAVSEAYKRIDKAAKTNVIHANTAARRKSLVTRKANEAGKAS